MRALDLAANQRGAGALRLRPDAPRSLAGRGFSYGRAPGAGLARAALGLSLRAALAVGGCEAAPERAGQRSSLPRLPRAPLQADPEPGAARQGRPCLKKCERPG